MKICHTESKLLVLKVGPIGFGYGHFLCVELLVFITTILALSITLQDQRNDSTRLLSLGPCEDFTGWVQIFTIDTVRLVPYPRLLLKRLIGLE